MHRKVFKLAVMKIYVGQNTNIQFHTFSPTSLTNIGKSFKLLLTRTLRISFKTSSRKNSLVPSASRLRKYHRLDYFNEYDFWEHCLGSYRCSCIVGFQGDGFNCTDTNECSPGYNDCPPNSICANEEDNAGKHACHCHEGYRFGSITHHL